MFSDRICSRWGGGGGAINQLSQALRTFAAVVAGAASLLRDDRNRCPLGVNSVNKTRQSP